MLQLYRRTILFSDSYITTNSTISNIALNKLAILIFYAYYIFCIPFQYHDTQVPYNQNPSQDGLDLGWKPVTLLYITGPLPLS